MIKRRVFKVAGIAVAVAASAFIMIRRRAVTRRTILAADRAVIKHGILEIIGVAVAGRAGTGKVIGRGRMARRAVSAANRVVVKDRVLEVVRIAVTGRAGAGVMVFRGGMAGRTIVVAHECVVEIDLRPVGNGVAARTICAKPAVMRIIVGMATNACRRSPFVVTTCVAA